MKKKVIKTKKCRLCNSGNLWSFLDLGHIPVSNELSKKIKKEIFPKLKILVCKNCWHVQSGSVPISKNVYKKNYSYHTRFSTTINEHFKKNAKKIIKKFKIKNKDLVIDIGGNDGTFLNHFRKINKKIKTLCVEPTIQTSNYAKKIGIDVFQKFFNFKNSNLIKKKYGIPKIILCTNSFGNIDDLHEFMKGIKNLSDKKTVFIFENPYLVDTLKGIQFDTMYYEHVSYFSITPLIEFFKTYNMEIINYEKTKVHGGSILVYVRIITKENFFSSRIKNIVKFENQFGLSKIKTYMDFSHKVKKVKNKINDIINNTLKSGNDIVAYGASDRGLVLLNYCEIKSNKIKYIVDKNPYKKGNYYTGTGMKIYGIDRLKKDKPHYIFLTAWNFKSEIINSLKKMGLKSKYIIPLKDPKIIN